MTAPDRPESPPTAPKAVGTHPKPADGDTAQRLADIEQRTAAATKGPWKWRREAAEHVLGGVGDAVVVGPTPFSRNVAVMKGPYSWDEDAAFIAHSRDDVPWLIAHIRTLTAERDEALRQLHEHTCQMTPADRILYEATRETVDEFVVSNVDVHGEAMSDSCYWLGICRRGQQLSVNVCGPGRSKPLEITVEDCGDDVDCPWDRIEEHKP